MKHSKKAQIWSLDLVIAASIISIGLIVFFVYSYNSFSNEKETFQILENEGNFISESLLSEGYPADWDNESVIRIGLLKDKKIDQKKLEMFYNMTLDSESYEKTKRILDTRYDFYLFIDENFTINSNSIEGIGKQGVTKDNINAVNLIKITRLTVYDNKPVSMILYVWEE